MRLRSLVERVAPGAGHRNAARHRLWSMSSPAAIAANAREPTPAAAHAIRMDERDNVAIVANAGGLEAGSTFATGFAAGLVLRERVPQAHKVALVDIGEGEPVLRYGIPIGYALKAIVAGSWVHERLLRDARGAFARRPADGDREARAAAAARGLHLRGLSQCRRLGRHAQHPGDHARPCSASPAWSSSRWRASRPSCCRSTRTSTTWSAWSTPTAAAWRSTRPDAAIPIRTLRNIIAEPELRRRGDGGEPGLREAAARAPAAAGHLRHVATSAPTSATTRRSTWSGLQDDAHVGFASMVDSILAFGDRCTSSASNARRRETVPARGPRGRRAMRRQRRLFSGATANPAVGVCTDLLVRAGATVMFSETTEVRDGIDQLTARAASPELAAAMIREMAWYDAYLGRGGADRSANTTPGNKAGGLSNIVEKAMGSIVKSGPARRSRACFRPASSCAIAASSAAWSTRRRRRATSSAAPCSWRPA